MADDLSKRGPADRRASLLIKTGDFPIWAMSAMADELRNAWVRAAYNSTYSSGNTRKTK